MSQQQIPERVLVVDDEVTVCAIVTRLLERSGYIAAAANCADDALRQLKENPGYDLVMSDVMMPEVDGLALLDQIGVDYPGTPVVMFTAVHDIHVATSAFRRGAVDYLLKPFDRQQMLNVVTRAVEHGKLKRQNSIYRHNLEEIVAARTSRLRATMRDLERSYDITLEAMGDALDLRDAETEGHSKRVTGYAIALAREMGLNADDLKIIARGAFLHDIGKISTPDEVLLKPGKLNDRETEIMREHCQRGYEMVRKIPFLREASEIVYAHQESFDGSGYPRGLVGEDIPLGARIFAVADTLDAITSDRPYRLGRSFAEARDEIQRCSGKQFDPVIVDIFLKIPVHRWMELRTEITGMSSSAISQELCRPSVAHQALSD
jgi:putative nucleotidyltransferase with HDIG domain